MELLLVLVQDFQDSPQERPGTFKVMPWVLESPQELTSGMLYILTGIMDLFMVIHRARPMEQDSRR